MLDEVQKGKKKLQPHGKLWCEKESGVDLSESGGVGGLMLSEHDLPVGPQGHLLAESDCGRLQLSRSRRGRLANVWRVADSLLSPTLGRGPQPAVSLAAARLQLYSGRGF